MATKKVNIDILAKDKTRQALGSVQKGLANVKGAVFNLRNAFLGLGAGLCSFSAKANILWSSGLFFSFFYCRLHQGFEYP